MVGVISGDRGLIPNPREIAPLPGVGRNIPSGGGQQGTAACAAGLGSSQKKEDTVLGLGENRA